MSYTPFARAGAPRGELPAFVRAPAESVVVAAVVVWALSLSTLFIGLRAVDDGFFIETAHLWLSGAPPYAHVFDVKPPGFFALLAVAEVIFGPTQNALAALTVFSEAAAGVCLWRIGRRIGAPEVGAFAAIGFPLFSRMFAANVAYPPLAMATAAAFLFAYGSEDRRANVAKAGLAIGFAITIKQTALFEAAALWAWFMLDPNARGHRLRLTADFASAALTAPLAFALLLAAQGAFPAMIEDIGWMALHRTGLEPESLAEIAAHFRSLLRKVTPLVVVALFAALHARDRRVLLLLLWLGASVVELWVQHARWLHYIGPTLAPLLLTTGVSVAYLVRFPPLHAVAMAILLLVEFVHAYPFRHWIVLQPYDITSVREAAAVVLARHPEPSDRLLAILQGEEINTDLNIPPPTAYFHWMHLICNFPGAGPERLREALAKQPRFIVAPREPFRPYCEDPRAWPMIDAALARDYQLITPSGALRVYELAAAIEAKAEGR